MLLSDIWTEWPHLFVFTYIVELITSSSICRIRDYWRDWWVDGSVIVTAKRMPVFGLGSSQKGIGLLELCMQLIYSVYSPVHVHKFLLVQF